MMHEQEASAPRGSRSINIRFAPGELKAFTFTPFVAAALWHVYALGKLLVSGGNVEWGRAAVTMLIGACTYGLFVAFGITYLVAVPCFQLLRNLVELNGLVVRSAGATIGAASGAVLGYLTLQPGPIGGGIIGWITAAIWWKLASEPADP